MADQKEVRSLEPEGFLDEQKSPAVIRGIALVLLAVLAWSTVRSGGITSAESSVSSHSRKGEAMCAGTENIAFAAGEKKRVGVRIQPDCLSGLVDIRALAPRGERFDYDFPAGKKEVYECSAVDLRKCQYSMAITGGEKGVVNLPHLFRMKGPSGIAYFTTEHVSISRTPRLVRRSSKREKKDPLAEEVERQYREILEMQRRRELLEEKRKLEKEKKKLEKKLGKLEKG